ncbi:MAG: class I SAM-dependent methyltransferase [Dehalococcoidia bacterium]|nr:class I SAM-dependent methyltransferase [Dehalococcoidia bacterium]
MDATEHQRLADFEEWYWWHRARQSIVTRLLRRYVGTLPGRILDVGCGTGATSAAIAEGGALLGVDLGPEAVASARARGLEVAQMDATSIGARSESFDLVVALDVLEHLGNPIAAAREFRRTLRPGGRLLVTVPAYQWLWSSHDVALGHHRRYTRAPLRRLLAEAGFEIDVCSYVMSAALPPAALFRLLERLPGRRPHEDDAESGYVAVPGWLNAILSRLVAFDGHLVGRVPIPGGLTVVALAHRT